jgi:hypothetical protein
MKLVKIQIQRKGISLVELVLTMAIFLIVLQVVYSIFFTGQNSFAVSNNKGFAQQGVRYGHIVISDELRYASSFISQEDFTSLVTNTRFYGLHIEENELIKTSYMYNSEASNYESLEIMRIPVDWDQVEISNTNSGKLDILIYQDEDSMNRTSDYNLSYSLELINSNLLDSDLTWDLSNGDVVYYTLAEDSNIGSISLSDEDNGVTTPDDPSDPSVVNLTVSISEVKEKSGNSWKKVDDVGGIYHIKKNTGFQLIFQISEGAEDLNRVFVLNSFTGSDSAGGTVYTINGTSSKDKNVGFNVSLLVRDLDDSNNLRAKGELVVSLITY